jgi:hypothetical protein
LEYRLDRLVVDLNTVQAHRFYFYPSTTQNIPSASLTTSPATLPTPLALAISPHALPSCQSQTASFATRPKRGANYPPKVLPVRSVKVPSMLFTYLTGSVTVPPSAEEPIIPTVK